jgi:hypothetical protein
LVRTSQITSYSADSRQCGQFRVAVFFSGRSSKNSRSSIGKAYEELLHIPVARGGQDSPKRNRATLSVEERYGEEEEKKAIQRRRSGENYGARTHWFAATVTRSSRPEEKEEGDGKAQADARKIAG